MSRHVAAALIAMLALHAVASADESSDQEKAIRERGLVLKAGKNFYFVFVFEEASANSTTNKFNNVDLYFGDAKVLYLMERSATTPAKGGAPETLELQDVRALKRMLIERAEDAYALKCAEYDALGFDRTIKLDLAGEAEAKKVRASAKFVRGWPGRGGFVIGREGTTYYYVDRPHAPPNNSEFRIFIGKRGAMKQVKIKEQSSDTKGATIVTAKGTLDIVLKPFSISWGRDVKHLSPLTVIPFYDNRKLVYSDLGVYTREKSGMPCHDM